MTIAEKVSKSRDKTILTLHREGLFYKCYNEDAMVFVKKVKEYKVSSKYIKSAGVEVLSMGFPASEVEKGNMSLSVISNAIGSDSCKEDTNGFVFSLKEDIKQNFEEFQKAIVDARESVVKEEGVHDDPYSRQLIKMIQEFDLANHTPMQGMGFIQELKTYIKKVK